LRIDGSDGTTIETTVSDGGEIGEHKGINAPGVPLPTSAITPKDVEDLKFGLSLGVDGNGLGTWATQELTIARRELHAQIIESHFRGSLAGFAAIAPLYGKVALPGDAIVHFETFLDAGLGAAWTETDATRGARPMVAAGIGQRISLGDSVALTARLGGNLYAERVVVEGSQQTKAMGFWSLRLGLSFYFGGGR